MNILLKGNKLILEAGNEKEKMFLDYFFEYFTTENGFKRCEQ